MTTSRARAIWLLWAIGCGSTASSPASPPPPAPPSPAPAAPAYRATIRWTSHGVPHVIAGDLGGVAFGQGYASATLHVCVLADQIVKLRSERAKLFGPGDGDANIESDFGWLALDVREEARRALPGLSADARALLRGYVAGYNRYVAETRPEALPPDCAGAAWVRPIDEVDLLSHWVQLGVLGSSRYFLEAIAGARPPGAPGSARVVEPPDLQRPDAPASNGWAIGAERSATGRGMLVANPHFPWEGELRFFESHLTIPGSPASGNAASSRTTREREALDAYGAALLGVPLVNIGFNEHVAWTHTFSSSRRFVIYRLDLDEAAPTRYRYGDETRALIGRDLAIQVRQPDGALREVTRRTYRSHHGPMIANKLLPWTARHAYTLRDVAGGNLGAIDQYLAMMRAKDLAGFEAALARWQATGFVNTIYADRDGNALYVDGSSVPDLPPAALGALGFARAAIPAVADAWKRGVVLADGSRPLFELASDPASARPGTIPYARAPRLVRRDFVANANDPYWLANPAAPLTGFSPLYGETGEPPSARTRMNLRLLQAAGAGWPAGEDGKFTAAELEAAILDHRAMTSELLRADVVARCRGAVRTRKAADAAALGRACDALAAWDGRYDVGSRGALLWREWLAAHRGSPYARPFDSGPPARHAERARAGAADRRGSGDRGAARGERAARARGGRSGRRARRRAVGRQARPPDPGAGERDRGGLDEPGVLLDVELDAAAAHDARGRRERRDRARAGRLPGELRHELPDGGRVHRCRAGRARAADILGVERSAVAAVHRSDRAVFAQAVAAGAVPRGRHRGGPGAARAGAVRARVLARTACGQPRIGGRRP